MSALAFAPVAVALVSVVLTLAVRSWPRLQQAASVGGVLAYAVAVAVVCWRVVFAPDAAAVAYQLGGWPAPFGITLVADALAAFMLAIAAVVFVYALAFSIRHVPAPNQRVYYHPLVHVLLLGVTGAFLTGDLFNLFVWFEVLLLASYVFVAFYGDEKHVSAATRYVVLNLVGSVVMLLAIGGLYATLGTLNMAEMARVLADSSVDTGPVVGLGGLLFATFALKAGLVPFQFWVPDVYRATPTPVVAIFAGVTKKVGIYAILRVYFTVFGEATVPGVAGDSPLSLLAPVLLVLGVASILVGGVGALDRVSLHGLLAYSSIGQVGFIAVAVAVAAGTDSATLQHLGVFAALVYALHHALAKGLLFLAAGTIRRATGTNRIGDLGGLLERDSLFAGTFLVGALSLVGIPPLAGFFGKFLVVETAVDAFARAPTAGSALVVAVLLAGAVLTIVYVTRAWIGSFWGSAPPAVAAATIDRTQVVLLATLAVVVVAVGVGFEPLAQFADAAATATLDTGAYVDVVGVETATESGGDHA